MSRSAPTARTCGVERYTYGVNELVAGIKYLPVLIVAVIWSFYYGIRRSHREAKRLRLERADRPAE